MVGADPTEGIFEQKVKEVQEPNMRISRERELVMIIRRYSSDL
jgi:hypothetical protein